MGAAKRQVRTAIKLWFMDEDPVSIHTLASAAHEIIHTLFKRKGLSDLLFDIDIIKDEYRGEWAKRLKADATFFKHAQRDPEAVKEFDPSVNEYLLLFCVAGLGKMGKPLGDIETTFLTWFGIQHPEFLFKDIYSKVIAIDQLENMRGMKRQKYFDLYCQRLLMERRIGG
jgi:hypothetical protein